MNRHRSASDRRRRAKTVRASLILAAVIIVILLISAVYFNARNNQLALDPETLCPSRPSAHTVLLVDVTDPMNLPQKQDFRNQLERLRNSIPRYGKLSIVKVDATSTRLLAPVIERCNPGSAADVDQMTGDPTAVQDRWEQEFKAPLDDAFDQLTNASGAERSPILESIQSVALTEFQTVQSEGSPRRLVIVSDLLQNTQGLSFYGNLPTPQSVLGSTAFQSARTDLSGVDVELWMLQRTDAGQSQPRELPDLWDRLISEQGGTVRRLYRVSG